MPTYFSSRSLLAHTLLFFSAAIGIHSADAEDKIDFNLHVRPIISGKCIACHGPDEEGRKAHLRLDTEAGSRKEHKGITPIVPGNPDASEIMARILEEDEDEVMPPPDKGKRLTPAEADIIQKWIKQGAKYDTHWAYKKPSAPKLPTATDPIFPIRNPIDAFVLEKLKAENLPPSKEADRWTLARRVALDLNGLPPTPAEAQAFVQDARPNAYERFVDAQLAKPGYGERWARVWLDLARYADSAGYADDRYRNIWGYRDWVIRAFNKNQPFDEFTIDQIAGDLRPNATQDQIIATAFHRNTTTNSEGGTNDEEFRNAAVVDRTNTTMEVWMGTTMACAQCHTHKYDPITQDEYFQFFDFFNQSEDADRQNESPVLSIRTQDQIKQEEEWKARIAALHKDLEKPNPALAAEQQKWLATITEEPKWNALIPGKATGQPLAVDPASGIVNLTTTKRPAKATYHLDIPTVPSELSAIQLRVDSKQTTNFVLSKLSASWTPADDESQAQLGRFVRIELKGKDKMIHLAEVQVFSNGQNVALAGKAKQSSTGFGGPAKLAIDGNTNGDFDKKSVTHTTIEKDPWFEIDLGKETAIDEIAIWNRTGANLEDRLAGYKVLLLDAKRQPVWSQSPKKVPKPSSRISLSGARVIEFASAHADYEQSGFPAASVLAAKPNTKTGWAIGGATGKPHLLTASLATPTKLAKGTLRVTLQQTSQYGEHLLTHFSLAASSDPRASKWSSLPDNIRSISKKKTRTAADNEKLAAHFRSISPRLKPQRDEIAKLEKQLKNSTPKMTVPIMRELPDAKRRVTNVQIRGNYKSKGNLVKAATPAAFHPLRTDLPRNRLALAHWLVDRENPLTARVMVNRFWDQIFGIGIVSSNEEFGSQGELPSHPEMLDWLAIEFQRDWDVKRLLKLFVTSSTYRQEAVATPELLEVDPQNRFYARGPRFRISAEMIRDQALAVSGLLSAKQFGPPVKPYQPNLGLRAAFGSGTDWKTSAGEDKYRRGIYTNWRRSSPYPSMAAFDAPNREVCTSRRGRTNTPLQALVTLNDPVYIEAAQALARRIAAVNAAPEEQAAFAWKTTLIRDPKPAEITHTLALYRQALERFSQQPERAKPMAEDPLGPIPKGADLNQLAAWTVVSNILLNLDETFLKR